MPSVNNYFDNNFEIFKDANWYGNSYVKIGVKIPLSDWLKYRNEKALAEYKINSNDVAYKNMQNLSSLNYLEALKDIEFTKSKYEDLKRNFNLEQENFVLVQQQFKEGRILIEDLSTSNYALQSAKNLYLQAAYNYLLAQLQMEDLIEIKF